MRNEYEEKIFDFYTQGDNFKTMVQVANAFPAVANKLIRLFWNDVLIALRSKYSEQEWEVGFSSSNFDDRFNKLWVYRKSWALEENLPKIAIGFENLQLDKHCWVGIFMSNGIKDHNLDAFRNEMRTLPELNGYKHDSNNWWVKWESLSPLITKRDQIHFLSNDDRQASINSAVNQVDTFMKIIDKKIFTILDKHKV